MDYQEYFTLNDKPIKINKDELRFYNLGTNRFCKEVPKDRKKNPDDKYHVLTNPRVIGTNDMIILFFERNNLDFNLLPEELSKEIDLTCVTKPNIKNRDLEDLTDDEINSIKNFSFHNLKTKIRITNVVDGDTYDGVFKVDRDFFKYPSCDLCNGNISKRWNVLGFSSKGTEPLLFKRRFRLFGTDTLEKNLEEGIMAKKFVEELCIKNKNIFYGKFYGPGKYGRELVELYFDSEYKISLGKEILAFRYEDGKTVADVYHGGTKSDRNKSDRNKSDKNK